MQYRMLGHTGLKVSEIALGCEGFNKMDHQQAMAVLHRAIKAGINFIDMYTPNPQARGYIGEILQQDRSALVVQSHLCSVWKNGQYECVRNIDEVTAGFEEMLKQLRTDFIDVGMIHYVDSLKVWQQVSQGPVMQYALEQQKAGRIKAIGISSHNPQVAQAAVDSGLIQTLMFSINPCYDMQPASEDCEDLWADAAYEKPLLNFDPQRVALYESCEAKGIGISVMKAFGGGDLLDAELSPAGAALTPVQCLHYALTRPAVAAVMSGIHDEKELDDALAYETADDEAKDYAAALAGFPRISWQGHCMYCGHCAPCPVGIDVASVTKFLNLAQAAGQVSETIGQHYAVLEHHASECIGCQSCAGRCPFKVDAPANMAKAAEIFKF